MLYERKKIKIVLILLALIMLPVIWYCAIGPRDISDSAEMSQQKIYYMGHEYHCVGWKLGPKVDVKTDKCIRYGVFENYYTTDTDGYIVRKGWQERNVYLREDGR